MCRHLAAAVAIALVTVTTAQGAATAADAAAILHRADASRGAFSEGIIRLRVTADERGKKTDASLLEIFVKGPDRSLVVFREGKQKGRKVLTVGDRVVLIVPGASRPIPVSKTQRLMGAASFGDIARLRLADDYDATLRPTEETIPGERGDVICRVLDLIAKKPGAAYPTATLWAERDDGRALELVLSLASGKEAKKIRFTAYDARGRVASMAIRDVLRAGGESVTRLAFEGYEEKPVDASIFDPEGARAVP